MIGSTMPENPVERIRHNLVGLRMPRALEALEGVIQQLERGLCAQDSRAEIHEDHGSVSIQKGLKDLGDMYRISSEFLVPFANSGSNGDRKFWSHHLQDQFPKRHRQLLAMRNQYNSNHDGYAELYKM